MHNNERSEMKRFLMLAVAFAAAVTMSTATLQADGGFGGGGVYVGIGGPQVGPIGGPRVGPIGGPQVGNFGPGGPIVGNAPAGPRYGFRGGRRGFRGRGFGGGFFPYAWNDFYNPYSFNRPERQPYFSMNPPVYYSDQIVPRPMGISPFPAPPGVTPVEMTLAPQSEKVVNPYFQKKDKPVSDEQSGASSEDTDT